ncbi:glycoside hydrolase family 88 protein [Belliella sp. DSM 107340]|uniref:Glycoside hydrolase family 88 protein n=1 Tax=Belliella calami TaxID=2923436 RepID=A0ABS9UKU7_9BACT|nr:glycoside hydrolase family 88 protein [Belliella calami]MCH7397244.1 glycoside hydrolase family 88 protein [Belliella calami]
MKILNNKISCFFLLGLVFHLSFGCSKKEKEEIQMEESNVDFVDQSFQAAKPLYSNLLKTTSGNFTDYPHAINPDGTIKYLQIDEWTGGFWPGILWYMYEYTEDDQWKQAALEWTHSLEPNQFNTSHHDIGFMMFCSYGNALRFEKKYEYDQILIESAKSLVKRYSPVVGSIQSWNKRKSKGDINTWEYPVIMDNMMNLELLFYATEITGDSSFYEVAIQHATQTMKNHIRDDFSTYHVVNYDPKNGDVLHQQTLQGFSDNSTWARGQAWGIYGFTTMYRATQDNQFLETAVGLADFFLEHPKLPEDMIPIWDFNVGEDGYHPDWDFDPTKFEEQPRDASAAAITASALLELSTYVDDEQKKKYFDAAEKMLKSLSSEAYLNSGDANPYFLLKHSTGNLPSGNEVDVPLIYADYYFLEALLRYKKMKDNLD